MQSLTPLLLLSLTSLISATTPLSAPNPPSNTTYTNPLLPGWHSDPSCVFIPTLSNTTFCITSPFLTFPGLPLYSSRDLRTWTLARNVFNRPEQVKEFAGLDTNADEGFWAATARYYLFSSEDPFDDSSWSEGLRVENPQKTIDPDLFWDDDGQFYMASGWGGIYLSTVNLTTGAVSTPATRTWNGTGGSNPEGPHIYKKDGWYYLLIAEGGSGPNHSATIARSPSIWGPYESYAGWGGEVVGCSLATRSGPEFEVAPMGRETVPFPVEGPEGRWPVVAPVRGVMIGWSRPAAASPPRPGGEEGILVDGADVVDFRPGEKMPRNWVHHRLPTASSFVVSPRGHEKTLQLVPSAANLTGNKEVEVADGLTFVGRRQSATLFKFSVDIDFDAKIEGEEAGITTTGTDGAATTTQRQLRFRATTFGKPNITAPGEVVVDIPRSWMGGPVRLIVEARDDEVYIFSASSTRGKKGEGEVREMGRARAGIVTGGSGRFVGTLVGAYATRNNGTGTAKAYLSRWSR
ncbi:hypothetical protein VF21_03911 [Pseudogymnoascus sp. 05NY08]|nr:hypothetical protein VF21_03911 [Pseudogymnoascus sp. 05NY08]